MPKSIITDHEILEAALVGLQSSLATVDAKIKDIRGRIGGKAPRKNASPTPAAPAAPAAAHKRTMSASARRRIAAAQKKRWAEYHKAQQK